MLQHAILILLLPLLSAAVIALFLRRQGGIAAIVSTLTAASIAAIALILALHGGRGEDHVDWLTLGTFTLSLGVKFDDLAALMLVIVGIVGAFLGGFGFGLLGISAHSFIGQLIFAVIGALLFLWLLSFIKK